MAQLARTLEAAARSIAASDNDDSAGEAAVAHLQDAGSQIGWLQTGCCAPSRMPLYVDMLGELSQAQRFVTRASGSGH